MKKILALTFCVFALAPLAALAQDWSSFRSTWTPFANTTGLPAGYLTIKDETTPLAAQGTLTFLGAGVTCVNSVPNSATECTIPGGSVADGDKGDITVSASGATWTIDPNAVTLSKFVQASAASILLGRGSAGGAGNYQEITLGKGLAMTGTVLSAACDPRVSMCPTFDEYACGASSAATVIGSCKGVQNVTNTNTGTAGTKTGDATAWGIGFLSTSTTTNGISAYTGTSTLATRLLDTAYWQGRFQLSRLSTTADKFAVIIGSHDASVSTSSIVPTDGVFFTYTNDDANGSPNWKINVASDQGGAGGTTTADSGVAAAATTWATFKWSYESGVGVHFYINGTETSNSPINANLPTASGREFASYNYKIAKTGGAGTLACELWFDYDVFGVTSLTR